MNEEKEAVKTQSDAIQQENEKLPPSRRGKRPITTWGGPDVHREIRIIAAEDDKTYEEVLADALNLLFRYRGKPPIAS